MGSHLFIYQALPLVYDSIFEAAGQYGCCGFAACKSYERPGRQTGKSWNSCRFSQAVVEEKISIVYGSPEAWNSELKSVDGPTRLLQYANKFAIKPSYLSSAK